MFHDEETVQVIVPEEPQAPDAHSPPTEWPPSEPAENDAIQPEQNDDAELSEIMVDQGAYCVIHKSVNVSVRWINLIVI